MKKTISKTVIAVVCVVALLAVAILVLSLVKVNPVNELEGYQRVEVYDLSSANREPELDADLSAKLEEGMKDTRFSVMQGILEGKVSGKFSFKTEAAEEGAEETRIEYRDSDITAVKATATAYMLEFVYGEVKTIEVEGEEVKFDRAIVLVSDSANEIGSLEVVFYQYAMVGNEAEDEDTSSEYYTVSPVVVNADTTALYAAIAEIVAAR